MEFIDLSKQYLLIRDKIKKRISNVLENGQYIMGDDILILEDALAKYVKINHCITCSSGTDALLMPLMARGIGYGDAVITSPFTFIATAEVIKLAGATPIFVDICPDTFNLDPELIPTAIQYAKNKGLNPKAIIPVDLFGLLADYEKIEQIATDHNLFVLEDAAQSFGATINNKRSCSFGNAASTSFFPAKPLGCYGDGGAIFTNNDEFASILKSIRVHGGGSNKYNNIRLGINARLDTLQAAVLIEKLSLFPNELIMRKHVAEYYTNNMPNQYRAPIIPNNHSSAWAQYSILTDSNQKRSQVIQALSKHNIPSRIYYKIPLHLQKVFHDLGYEKDGFPASEKISSTILSLPMHPYLEADEQNKTLEVLDEIK